jgi:O-antigen biosynthesis protein WbqP
VKSGLYRAIGKRAFDIVSAAVALLVLGPLMAVTALLIRSEDGGPALFRQARVGAGGRPFTVFKFRSMGVLAPNVPSAAGTVLPITRVGRFIRRTNIDELPQLLNILIGDMSVVGPRPPLPAQEELLALRSKNGALALRPGLTGLAQVSSYDGMPESEKAAWDGRYAERVTLLGDLAIIARTFGYLAKRPPVY